MLVYEEEVLRDSYKGDKIECCCCNKEFVVDAETSFTDMSDIRDGQYVEYDAVICPECGGTNEL